MTVNQLQNIKSFKAKTILNRGTTSLPDKLLRETYSSEMIDTGCRVEGQVSDTNTILGTIVLAPIKLKIFRLRR